MKKTKFDLLFENIMAEVKPTDAEIFGNDICIATLKVYKLTDKGFTNLIYEIDNFKFLNPDKTRSEAIADLEVIPSNVDINFELCKIMVFEKKSNELKFECITFLGDDSNEIIDLISYNENPRGTFEGYNPQNIEDLYEEDSDSFDKTYKDETIEYKDHFINIESFDDQGDIVYMWNVDNGKLSDLKYYDKKEHAIAKAKSEIDFLIDGVKPEIKGDPICPFCKHKVTKSGIFFYDCLNHGKIKSDKIEFERI